MKNNKLLNTLIIAAFVGTNVNAQDSGNRLWVTLNDLGAQPQMKSGRLVSDNEEMKNLIKEYSILSFEQALPDSRQENLQRVFEVECLCNQDALAEAMEKTDILTGAERAPEYELLSTPDDYTMTFSQDYALDLINAKDAWDFTTGDTNIVLGISDGSFFVNHEELQSQYVYVYNSIYAPTYYYHHGTAVATTVAGSTNNGTGKSAIGYNCRMDMRPIGYNYMLQMSYAGARVINVSWTSGCFFSSYYQGVIDEIYLNGTIIVAAAGNGGTCGGPTALVYPAALDHTIAVTSIGPNDNHERYQGNPNTTHQHNSSVDICAPGYDVALTVAPGWYLTGNGTSFAAPYVSGTIGLMLSMRPCLTYEDVLDILQQTAANIDAQNPAYVGTLGAGRVDAGAAMKYLSEMSCESGPGNGHGNGSGGVDPTGDGNNGHGNDDGNFDPSNPGQGNGNNGTTVVNGNTPPVITANNGNGNNGNGNGNNNGNNTDTHVVHGNVGNMHADHHGNSGENGNGNRSGQDGSGELNLPFEANIYPNPTNTSAIVRWNQPGISGIDIMAVDGSLVSHLNAEPGMVSMPINLEQTGVYYIRLSAEDGVKWAGKLVKL